MDNYYGQFMIARKEFKKPREFHTYELNSWITSVHKSLAVTSVYTLDNVHVGWIIGYLIDNKNRRFIEDKVIFPFSSEMVSDAKDIVVEKFLYSFGGRYICVLFDKDLHRVYLDAGGSLSCIYSLDDELVASSPGLLLDQKRYFADLDENLYKVLGMPEKGWYPSGLTPHVSVRRLLPNHYLDLVSWKSVRHWPRERISYCNDPALAVENNINVIKATIETISQKFNIYLTLTGGRDSRTLLACSRQLVEKIQLITFIKQNESVDEYVAKLLADRFKLNINLLLVRLATKEEKSNWLYEVGHCVGGRIADIHRTLAQLDSKRVILPGLGTEVAKELYRRKADRDDTYLSSKMLLQRLRLPPHPLFQAETSKWLSELEYLNIFQVLDLAHIEQRLGCWAGPQIYGQVEFIDHIYPAMHREIFENILSMPQEFRRNYGVFKAILKSEWPELLEIPVNEFLGIRGIIEKIKKVRMIPSKIQKLIDLKSEFKT